MESLEIFNGEWELKMFNFLRLLLVILIIPNWQVTCYHKYNKILIHISFLWTMLDEQ